MVFLMVLFQIWEINDQDRRFSKPGSYVVTGQCQFGMQILFKSCFFHLNFNWSVTQRGRSGCWLADVSVFADKLSQDWFAIHPQSQSSQLSWYVTVQLLPTKQLWLFGILLHLVRTSSDYTKQIRSATCFPLETFLPVNITSKLGQQFYWKGTIVFKLWALAEILQKVSWNSEVFYHSWM